MQDRNLSELTVSARLWASHLERVAFCTSSGYLHELGLVVLMLFRKSATGKLKVFDNKQKWFSAKASSMFQLSLVGTQIRGPRAGERFLVG